MSIRIGIDGTYGVGRALSGVGRYSVELVRALAGDWPEVQWKQYYRAHRFLRAPWPKRLLLEATPRSCDLFHGLNQRLPKRRHIPCVSTFHDLFVLSAEYSSPEFRQRFAEQARQAAEGSARILAVSHFTAAQIREFLGYPEERIRVVPHGVRWPAHVRPPEERPPVVLTVGAVQARKNTRRLVEAFRALPAPWELWIAGSMGYGAEEVVAAARGEARVKWLGYVAEAELAALYEQARIFAFPSLDEGFGIPVLEAMAHGAPVLTANRSALPEVAGDAAVQVDPFMVEAIADGLRKLAADEAAREYIRRGRERAKEFSWERAARLTVAAYREVLAEAGKEFV